MKKISISLIALACLLFLYSCTQEDITNQTNNTHAGVFVLYEGLFNQPGSGDYAFIHENGDSISNYVFQNNNSGANLGLIPDGMLIYLNLELFVSSQGQYGGPGNIYRINSRTNQLTRTSTFGQNPYSIAYTTSRLYATNISGSTVTKLDLDFTVLATINVGANPSEITTAGNYVYVSKASYSNQNTFSVINISTDNVTQIQLATIPVSSTVNNGVVYISSYTGKKIYKMNYADTSNPNVINDTIILPQSVFNYAACTDIVSGDFNTLYVVGADTGSFGYNTGKSVYKINTQTEDVSLIIQFTGGDEIYGIGYDREKNYLYVANSKSGLTNGQVLKYDRNGILIKTYEIGGRYPRRFAFAY